MTADRPIIGVGVVVLDGDHILLIKRGKEPRKGLWTIPGGKQEMGEPIETTAQREVLEETAIDIDLKGLLGVVDLIERDEGDAIERHYTLIDFWARPLSMDICAGDDAADARWVPLSQLKDYNLWQRTHAMIDLAVEAARTEESGRARPALTGPARRFRPMAHLKVFATAVVFGMAAYGIIRLMIWLSKLTGSVV